MTIRIDGTNTAASPGITGTDTDTGLQFGTDEVSIVTGGAERLKVDSSGNLIHKFPGRFKMQEGNNLAWSFHNNGYGGSLLFTDESDGTEQVRFQGTGGISFNGDTAAANALDDYEEGTWTPNAFDGNGSASTTVFSAPYTKIGHKVFFECYIRITKNSANGNLHLHGLPYNSNSNGNYHSAISVGYFEGLSANNSSVVGTVQPNSDQVLVRYVQGTGDDRVLNVANGDISATFEIILNGSYIIS